MADEVQFKPRGLHFEDFVLGQIVVTQSRTITEADIVTFAGLSGDYNQIHTDSVYASQHAFGQRVAHGMLVASIASGLAVLTGFIEGTVLAFRELENKFSAPVFIGDTIHVQLEVVELKELRRMGGGNVVFKVTVKNQDGKVVQRGRWTMLVMARPASSE